MSVQQLHEMGYQLAGTPGTANFYTSRGITMTTLEKPTKPSATETASDKENINNSNDKKANGKDKKRKVIDEVEKSSALTWIKEQRVDLLINIPEGSTQTDEISAGYMMRRAAVDFGCALLTNLKCASMFAEAMSRNKPLPCKSAEEFIGKAAAGYADTSGITF